MRKNGNYYRKPRRQFSRDITTPNESVNLRTVINRMSRGLPIGAHLREHKPLPPDGIDLSDFETGTEEIVDIVDAVEQIDRLQAEQKKLQEQQEQQSQQPQPQQVQQPQQQEQQQEQQ